MRLSIRICACALPVVLAGGNGQARAELGCGDSGSFTVELWSSYGESGVVAIDTFAPGDFDRDDDVDLGDFSPFQACFNGPNRPAGEGCLVGADLDGDADVDLGDFAIFQACFNGPNRPPACW